MDPYSQDVLRCVKCRAPIGRGGGRCPLCGAELPVGEGAKPFVPAIVGLNPHNEAAKARSRSVAPPPAPLRSSITGGKIALACCGLVLASVGVAFLLRYAMRPTPVAAVAPPPSVPHVEMLMLNGVPIADRQRVDPTDLLPGVRRQITEGTLDAALVEIRVVGAKGGVVNLNDSGAQVSYRYVTAKQGSSAADPLSERERVDLVVSDAVPPIRKGPSSGDKTVAEPLCVWSAAARAVIASGLSPSFVYDAKYAYNAKADKPLWMFSVQGQPELEREIDGVTCAIRVRPVAAPSGKKK